MKFKTTRKAIVNNCPNIVSVGYCDLYHLLSVTEPVAYTCGVYGWNFDVYQVDDLTICTGYRNMPGRTANNIREYEERAKELGRQYSQSVAACGWRGMTYEQYKAKMLDLLHEFAEQA